MLGQNQLCGVNWKGRGKYTSAAVEVTRPHLYPSPSPSPSPSPNPSPNPSPSPSPSPIPIPSPSPSSNPTLAQVQSLAIYWDREEPGADWQVKAGDYRTVYASDEYVSTYTY